MQAEADGQPFTYSGLDPDLSLQAAIFAQRQAEYNFKLENYAQKINGLVSAIAKANSDAAGYRNRLAVASSVEQMRRRSGKAAGRQQAQHPGGDGQPRGDGAQPEQRTRRPCTAPQRDLAARSRRARWLCAILARRHLGQAGRCHRQAVGRARVAEQGAASPATRGIACRARRHGADRGQGVGRFGAAVGPAVHHAGAGRRAAGSRGQHFRDATTASCMSAIRWRSSSTPSRSFNMAWPMARCAASAPTASPRRTTSAIRPAQCRCRPTTIEPFYRARIAIDRVDLHGTPQGFRIMPGMPVTADIKVGKRTVLQYLLGRVVAGGLRGDARAVRSAIMPRPRSGEA